MGRPNLGEGGNESSIVGVLETLEESEVVESEAMDGWAESGVGRVYASVLLS